MTVEYRYVQSHTEELRKHIGKWIMVVGEEIVAADEDCQKALDKAREKHPGVNPFVMKIPKERPMIT